MEINKKTLAELVSDLTPDELRVFDKMLREAANEIHDYLIKDRGKIAETKEAEKKARRKVYLHEYYLKNKNKT